MSESKDYGIAIGTITKFLSLPFRIQYKIALFIGSPFNINLDDAGMIMEMFDYVAENGLIEKLREEINREFNDYKKHNAEMMVGQCRRLGIPSISVECEQQYHKPKGEKS